MADAWQLVARNYARYDTPLRPNDDTLHALRTLIQHDDPLVVVLGATPLFGRLAQRVWFIDASSDALHLVEETDGKRAIHADWMSSADALGQADLIVGDGSVNALSDGVAAHDLLERLRACMKPGATLALRTFLRHELPTADAEDRLAAAFGDKRFSEVRFLVYGLVARRDGLTRIGDIDAFIADLPARAGIAASSAATYIADYFAWRGMPPAAAAAIATTAYFPSRAQFDALLENSGWRARVLSAGRFPLAEFTPIYVATV